MAKYEIPFDIALTYDNRQLKEMKFQDLQRTASSLMKEARRRVKELEKVKDTMGESPAYTNYDQWRKKKSSKGNYSARYKGKIALLNEIREAKAFLDNTTSTVEGFQELIDDLDRQLGFGTDLQFRKEFYKQYNDFKEEEGIKLEHKSSDPTLYFDTFKEIVAGFGSPNKVDYKEVFKQMREKQKP